MKNDIELKKAFIYLKDELFQKHLNKACWMEQQSRGKVNIFNKKKWHSDMHKGYDLLLSLLAEVFGLMYDSEAELDMVIRNFTKIALENYTLPNRTRLGGYVELCFAVFYYIVSTKIMYFNGSSKDTYNEMLKKTDIAFQYLEELFAAADTFGC